MLFYIALGVQIRVSVDITDSAAVYELEYKVQVLAALPLCMLLYLKWISCSLTITMPNNSTLC